MCNRTENLFIVFSKLILIWGTSAMHMSQWIANALFDSVLNGAQSPQKIWLYKYAIMDILWENILFQHWDLNPQTSCQSITFLTGIYSLPLCPTGNKYSKGPSRVNKSPLLSPTALPRVCTAYREGLLLLLWKSWATSQFLHPNKYHFHGENGKRSHFEAKQENALLWQ